MTLCVPSTAHEWQTPTDCPAWSPQGQVAHRLGSELRLRGRVAPEPTPRDTSESGSMRDLWQIRIFDAWIPQQDMRRAVKRPGDLAGPVADHAVGRVAMAMPGSAGRTVALRTEGGRARLLDEIPVIPTVRLSLDVETFTCLGCGRWNPAAPCSRGKSRARAIRSWAR